MDNSVQVTVRKIGDAGKLLDVATKAGANGAGNLSFGLSGDTGEKAKQEALALAVSKARAKAVTIAKTAKAGKMTLLSVSEEERAPDPRPMTRMASERMVSTPISLGELTVSAAVTVRYSFDEGLQPNYE